jgi:hypothetical protein
MEWFQDQLSLQLEQKSKQGLLPLKNRINFKILRRTLIIDVFGFPLLDSLQLPRLIDSAAQVISSHWNLIAPVANTATSIINRFTSGGTPKVQSSTIEPVPEAASFTTNSGPVLPSDVTSAEPLNGELTSSATQSTRMPLKWRRTRPESISN